MGWYAGYVDELLAFPKPIDAEQVGVEGGREGGREGKEGLIAGRGGGREGRQGLMEGGSERDLEF